MPTQAPTITLDAAEPMGLKSGDAASFPPRAPPPLRRGCSSIDTVTMESRPMLKEPPEPQILAPPKLRARFTTPRKQSELQSSSKVTLSPIAKKGRSNSDASLTSPKSSPLSPKSSQLEFHKRHSLVGESGEVRLATNPGFIRSKQPSNRNSRSLLMLVQGALADTVQSQVASPSSAPSPQGTKPPDLKAPDLKPSESSSP
mmetsp:Transcript_12210/g.24504  ORF Transcript_12210/g.24504 Transcript_12210/m.24504 type:complete len:201 (-) Transcript_12210:1196-1798(-)